MADTNLSLYEIEVAIARSEEFNYLKKLVVFNVIGQGSTLPLWHECDVLVCTKIGYLTEIEIKRSYSDFLNDFKKEHDHYSEYIKNFYYCIPAKILPKVLEYMDSYENKEDYRLNAGIIIINEDKDLFKYKRPKENKQAKKLSIEQMLYLARLGSMRVISLKNKIIKKYEKACQKKKS